MRYLNRIVPVSLCLASALILSVSLNGSPNSAAASPQAADNTPKPAAPAAQTPPAKDAPKTPPAQTPGQKPGQTPGQTPGSPTPNLGNTQGNPAVKPPVPAHAAAPKAPVDPALLIVKAEPAELDLGDIATMDSKKGKIKLHNTGSKPMTVVSNRASCGCTSLKLAPNTVIPAGESVEVEVQMSGGTSPGPVHGKTVTFVVEGQPDLVVPLKAVAVSFVVCEPAQLDPQSNPEGKFKLKAIDGTPFKIMSMQPAVITEFPKEAQAEYNLTISWAKYREVGINRRTAFFLDHPKCQQVAVITNFTAEEFAEKARKDQEKWIADREKLKGAGGTDNMVTPPPTAPAPDPDAVLTNLLKGKSNDEFFKKLATGLDPNYRDSSGTTLLGMAAKAGNVEVVDALLNTKKVEVDATDKAGRTPLMHAATSKNADVVRALLKAGGSVSVRDTIGNNALSWASFQGDAASVRELIDAGSDVDVVGSITGWTPLIWASGFGDPESIEPLVKAHANIEAADQIQGATPLIHAARTGRVESLKALLKHKPNIEGIDNLGNTAFLAAAATSGGTAEKLQVLIDAKCNIKAKNNQKFNALDLAEKRTDPRAAEVVKLLEPLLGSEKRNTTDNAAASTDNKAGGSASTNSGVKPANPH